MAAPGNRKGRSLSWVAGVGATLALLATTLTTAAAPAVAGESAKATVTTVTATSPALAGQPITITATVSHGGGAPTGIVTFSMTGTDGSTAQCAGGTNAIGLAPASRGSQAQCSIPAGLSDSASPYQITAVYGGDSTFASSVGSLSKTVHKVKPATAGTTTNSTSSGAVKNVTSPATVTLTSSVPGVGLVTGEAVTFTATVTTSGAPATGSIDFAVVSSEGQVANCDGGNTQPVSTSGGVTTATCSFAKGLLGKPLFYNVSATLMDPNYTGSATLVQLIDKSLTNTTVKQLPGSVLAGQAFTFNAVVQDISPGAGSPTGSMEFAVCPYFSSTCTGAPGGVLHMAAPTKWDVAHNENRIKFSLPSGVLTPGFYTVSADYVGDSNYWSSQSNFSYLLVTPVPTEVSLVKSDNPTFDGGREILRAIIKGDSRATQSLGGPTGTVTFTITGRSGDTLNCEETGTPVIPVGTKSANQGVARCSISGKVHSSDSPYVIKAVYSGDSVYNGSSRIGGLKVVDHP